MAQKKSPKQNKQAVVAEKPVEVPAPQSKLVLFNRLLAVLYALQAVAVVVFSSGRSAEVTTQYLTVDVLASEARGHEVLATATRTLFDLPLAWVVAAALLVLAVGHVLVSTVYRRRYEQDLSLGLNRWRWLTLGLSSALLIVVMGLLGGIHQMSTLLPLVALTAIGNCLVLMTEKLVIEHKGVKTQMAHLMCLLAALCIALPWIVLAMSLKGAWFYDGHVPGYLYGVYGSGLAMVVILGLATHFRLVRKGQWADTFYTERAYMMLGFVTVSLVAWQIVVGALWP